MGITVSEQRKLGTLIIRQEWISCIPTRCAGLIQVRSRRISQQEFAQALSQVPCARMQFDVDESGIDVRVPCEDVHHEWISASVADTNRDSYDGKGIGLRRKSAGDQSSRASHCRPVQCRATVRSSRPIQRRNRVESRRFASTSSTAQLELRTELVQLFGLHQSSAEVSDHSIEAVRHSFNARREVHLL
eukprot:SAG31_NODE_1482_length_8175_cov_4.484398_14_plen_189_part_00